MSAKVQSSPLPLSITVEFFDWWQTELRCWLGRSVSAKPDGTAAKPADLLIGRESIFTRDEMDPFAIAQPVEAIKALKRERQTRNKKLHIQFASDRFIVRKLAGNRIPLARAYRMAELDISANTPFALEDVYILFCRDEDRGESTDYVLLRRNIIDPVLEALRANNFQLEMISLAGKDGHVVLHPNAIEHFNSKRSNILGWLRKRLFVLMVSVAAVLIFWNVFSSLEKATAKVVSQIERVEPIANKARAAFKKRAEYVSHLQQLYREKQQYIPTAKLLEELTHIIPNDTYLTDFTLRNQKIQIAGFSTSAANLIAIIDASPFFAAPRFTTAVVKVPDRNGEQFNIELELEHAG